MIQMTVIMIVGGSAYRSMIVYCDVDSECLSRAIGVCVINTRINHNNSRIYHGDSDDEEESNGRNGVEGEL